MRISTNYQFESSNVAIQNAQQEEFTLQQELSTGKSINQPSDNPFGFNQSLSLTSLQSSLNQYNSNLSYAKSFMDTTSSALTNVNSLVNQAYQLAVTASNSTTDSTAMQGMVSQITAIQQQIVSLANTQGENGEYVFAGQKTQSAPFSASSGSLVYSGDGNNLNVQVGPNNSMTINTQAGTMLSNLYSQLQTFKSDLSSGNVGAISNVDIANLQSSQNTILQAQGAVGGSLQEVTNLTNQNTQRVNDLTTQLTNLTSVNYAQVATQYQSASTVYQAAVAMASQVSTLTLANYISAGA